jgi:hypothetical protein
MVRSVPMMFWNIVTTGNDSGKLPSEYPHIRPAHQRAARADKAKSTPTPRQQKQTGPGGAAPIKKQAERIGEHGALDVQKTEGAYVQSTRRIHGRIVFS